MILINTRRRAAFRITLIFLSPQQQHWRSRGLQHPFSGLSSESSSSSSEDLTTTPPSSILEAAKLLQEGKLRPTELVRRCLKRQKETASLNAYVCETAEKALQFAQALEENPSSSSSSSSSSYTTTNLLTGIPIAIKDNFVTNGVPSTASSKMLADFIPPYSATVVERLEGAGAISIGKTNMDEYGMGSATIFSHFGETINPWSPVDGSIRLVAGGSSGGSAVAVATGSCLAAVGSDTGGSVRQPAAICGIVGFKPTYGRVSRHGLIAYASSLDCPGILTRTVSDAAIVLDALAGPDQKDSLCINLPPPSPGYFASLTTNISITNLKGIKIGIPAEFRVEEMDEDVVKTWNEGARMSRAVGAEIVPVSIPSIPLALPAYFVIACAEASSNLSRYDGIRYGYRATSFAKGGPAANGEAEKDQGLLHAFITACRSEGFGPEVQRRILAGCHVLSAKAYSKYYERALAARALIRKDMNAALSQVDTLLTPVTPSGPFPVGQPAEPASLMLNDIMTIPASLAGLPAISVPVSVVASSKFNAQGASSPLPLPVGLQIIGKPLGEMEIFKTAAALERMADFESQVPHYVRHGSR